VREDPQARLDVVLARPASGRDVLRGEAREVDLSERRRPREHPLPGAAQGAVLDADAHVMGAVVEGCAEKSVAGFVVGGAGARVDVIHFGVSFITALRL